jgi:dipeptidyl aminopeptidase/acylaminoacyl peptidase
MHLVVCFAEVHTAQIQQGSVDPVVPPSQAKQMVETIRSSGGQVKYTEYDGEGHGWRRAETIRAALEEEFAFYQHILGLASS